MSLNVEALLAPISEADPAGPHRPASPARVEIERFFEVEYVPPPPSSDEEGKPPAGPPTNRAGRPDIGVVIKLIVEELGQTKDVELGAYLARAGVQSANLELTADGVDVTEGLLTRYWDSLHPALAISDVIGRRNICQIFGAYAAFVRPLQAVAVLKHDRLGLVTVADMLNLARDGEGGERFGLINAIVHGDVERKVVGVGIEAVETAVANLARLEKGLEAVGEVFVEHGQSVDIRQTLATLTAATKGLGLLLSPPVDVNAPMAEEGGEEGAGADPADAATPAYRGVISSRQDVVKALEAICDYYDRKEPASPVPFALKRAKTWVKMSFLEVLRDISPNSVEEVKGVLLQRFSEEK